MGYISSLVENAQTFAQKIRGHWKIEKLVKRLRND